jgi:hypothetical protein
MRHYVGFDVGKGSLWACVLDAEGEVVLSRRVEATEEALEAACKEIAELGVTDERVVGIDLMGGPAALLEVPTTTRGYERLLRWAEGFGPLGCAGIEGPAASDRNPTHAASLGALRKVSPSWSTGSRCERLTPTPSYSNGAGSKTWGQIPIRESDYSEFFLQIVESGRPVSRILL